MSRRAHSFFETMPPSLAGDNFASLAAWLLARRGVLQGNDSSTPFAS
jgi:hypothetical protein